MNQSSSIVRPVGESERIAALDILRGVALFGVLLVNFVDFAGPGTTVKKLLMSLMSDGVVAASVYVPILLTVRSVKLAQPEESVRVNVPPSVAPPGLVPIATERLPLAVLTRFP